MIINSLELERLLALESIDSYLLSKALPMQEITSAEAVETKMKINVSRTVPSRAIFSTFSRRMEFPGRKIFHIGERLLDDGSRSVRKWERRRRNRTN